MTAVKMLESNERSDCKAAGFGKHVVGIAFMRMFPKIPIRAELCWLYLTDVFELMARSRTGDIGAESVWSQSLCLTRPQPRCRSTKPCEQISTSSIRVWKKKGLGLRFARLWVFVYKVLICLSNHEIYGTLICYDLDSLIHFN